MIIIHSVSESTLPRLVARSLRDRLRVMPAVVVTGARQTGKRTLAQKLAARAGAVRVLDELLDASEEKWKELVAAQSDGPDWRALARRGRFPTPAVQLETAEETDVLRR